VKSEFELQHTTSNAMQSKRESKMIEINRGSKAWNLCV